MLEVVEPTPAAPHPPLEDLMRLPTSVGQLDPVTGRWRAPAADDTPPKADPQRVRLELEQRQDRAAARPSTARSRTDAGVSVDVAESVRVRGGVRLEQESGREAEAPVPTVGIEKRF